MKVAIHKEVGSFSDRWIRYCIENSIPHKIVNLWGEDPVSELRGCSALFWHWNQTDYKSELAAKEITRSLQYLDLTIFPNIDTTWHFDDKVAQSYLFRCLDVPHVSGRVFYDRQGAIEFLKRSAFPLVFKLRSGAGSNNVKLVRNLTEGKRLVYRSFGRGFSPVCRKAIVADAIMHFRRNRGASQFGRIITSVLRYIFPSSLERFGRRERGYVYFQDFVEGADHDIRSVVIGDRCFGFRRNCRPNDFRASGSGLIDYGRGHLTEEIVRISFRLAKLLNMQSAAIDFVKTDCGYSIIEVSYCYKMGKVYDSCSGYYDSSGNWNEEAVDPQRFIIEDVLRSAQAKTGTRPLAVKISRTVATEQLLKGDLA